MGRAFAYVILGGGVAAGYAALEFVRRRSDGAGGELCIISNEAVAPYERPALSKGYLLPEGGARLPAFHTCVGANDQLLTAEWYKEHGIELILGTRVISADVHQKTLLTSSAETISYKTLIVATGAQPLKLEEIGVSSSDAENICYLRNLNDADKLVRIMRSCPGGDAIVIGGGYIGMECAAALVANKIKVTMVFRGKYCMNRLFTPKIAEFYENYYTSKGITFIKGTVVSSFEVSSGKVTAAILRDGRRLPADMVVVGIGARASTALFEGQLAMEKGGIKLNGRMQTSDASVYAVGNVAAFPVKLFGGDVCRLEHVDCARRTARHAVAAALDPSGTGDIDYLPFFYSRVFALSWRFYSRRPRPNSARSGPAAAGSPARFSKAGARRSTRRSRTPSGAEPRPRTWPSSQGRASRWSLGRARAKARTSVGFVAAAAATSLRYAWHATVGVAAAVSIAAFAYWYGWKAPYLARRDF